MLVIVCQSGTLHRIPQRRIGQSPADPQSESGLDDDSDDDSESDSGDDTEHDSKVENNTLLVQFELSICAIPVAARACFTCSTMPLAEEKS